MTCMGVRRIHKNSSEHANLICRPTTCIAIKWKIIIITNSFSHVETTQWGSDILINSFRDCCRWHIIIPFTKILTQEEHADCRIFHAAGRHTCTGSVTAYDEVTLGSVHSPANSFSLLSYCKATTYILSMKYPHYSSVEMHSVGWNMIQLKHYESRRMFLE
jgi:hypothetical protein